MSEIRLAILDVSHGNSAVLQDTKGIVIIDTGQGDALRQFLKGEGIHKIDAVLLSHADIDHIGGLVHLLACNEFRIGRVVVNADSLKDTDAWEDLRYELERAFNAGNLRFKVGLTKANSGEFDFGEVQIEILGPSSYLAGAGPGGKWKDGRRVTTNSISAVIRLSKDGKPIALFPGDIDEVGLDDLILWQTDAHAPFVVFPHHGGSTGRGNLEDFVEKICSVVGPETVVFSIGRGPMATPRPEVVSTIIKHLPGVRIVCTQLSEHCAKEIPGIEAGHLNKAFSQGRESRTCCAGTIVILISDSLEVLPARGDHEAFIRQFAPTALCRG